MAVIDSRSPAYMRALDSSKVDEEAVLIDFVSNTTGIPKNRIRWAWKAHPGSPIPYSEDWCAIGIQKVRSSTPYRKGKKGNIDDAESGDTTQVTQQTLTVSFNFYGPNASELSDLFRDAAQLDQNFRHLNAKGLTIQRVSDEVLRLPDLVGNQWRDRYMLELNIGRVASRRFGVRTLCAADFELYTEKGKL